MRLMQQERKDTAELERDEIQELIGRMRPERLRDLREFATRLYSSEEEKMQVILPQGVDISVQRYDKRDTSFGKTVRRWLSSLFEETDVKLFVPKGLDVVVKHYQPERSEWKLEKVGTSRPRRDDDHREEEREFREASRDREIPGDRERVRRERRPSDEYRTDRPDRENESDQPGERSQYIPMERQGNAQEEQRT